MKLRRNRRAQEGHTESPGGKALPYRQNVAGCLAETVGTRGVTAGELDAALAAAKPALARLVRQRADGSLPLLHLPGRSDDIAAFAPLAEEFRRRFDHVVVLGIGGSSLGGQTLLALVDQGFGPRPGAPRVHFMENIDPASFAALFAALDPRRTGFVVISKSGSTAEPLSQLLVSLDWLRRGLGSAELGDRVLAITDPEDNVLRRLAGRHKIRVLDHDPGIGGRYAVLSNVGLFPAVVAGLDAQALRRGAAAVVEATLAAGQPREALPALGAAICVALAERRGIRQSVLMPYIDRLASFGLWFRQLWAESLGKGGKGTTPIRAMGVVDQHSQLQLYIEGPADKMFTLVTLEAAGEGERMAPDLADDRELAYFAGKTMGDLLAAEQRATATSLIRNGRPTRIFELQRLDEESLGALLMHFMLETIIGAELIGVDAFDQPAVEEGKVLARQYLAEMRSPA